MINIKVNSENRKFPDNINLSEDNFTFLNFENNKKNIRINSASQNNSINEFKCNIIKIKRNHKLIERHQSTESYNILNSYYLFNPLSSYNNSPITISLFSIRSREYKY